MKLDIMNIDKFVEANKCPKITNPIFFNYNTMPTDDGLFSYELFGVSDEERKNIFGYIDLNYHFIHPVIFQMIYSRMGALKEVINGTKYAVIANKKIQIVSPETPGAETGIDFLYDHFEEINWLNTIEEEEIDSIDKKTRLKALNNIPKDEFFITKWLVLPPFYRAESSQSRSLGDSINKLYKELIQKTNALKTGFSFSLFGDETKLRIQILLRDIYYAAMAPVSGKNLILEKGRTEGSLVGSGKTSMLRKHLVGKNVDWTASCVITAAENSSAIKFEKKPIPFGTCGFPLATLLSMFYPFVVSNAVQFLEWVLRIYADQNIHKIKKINMGQFSPDELEKLVKKFIKSPANRFDPVEVKYTDLNDKPRSATLRFYTFKSESDMENNRDYIERDFTYADLFSIIAKENLSEKHVYVTRYPVANFQNIFPSRVKVLTTAKTYDKMYYKFELEGNIGGMVEDYPYIRYEGSDVSQTDSEFYDVMICGNAYLAALGGDFDGDMLYLKPVFSQEANIEAEELIWAKSNMLNAKGDASRGLALIGKEAVVALYELTKDVQ